MIVSLLFILICCTISTTKYLNLGKNGCSATGNNAYVDNQESDICSISIPKVNSISGGFNPGNFELTINVKESGTYEGLENLVNFLSVTIEQSFTGDDMTIIRTQSSSLSSETTIDSILFNSENAKITLEGPSNSLYDFKISSISMLQSVNLYFENIVYTDITILLLFDFTLPELIKSYTPELLIFNYQGIQTCTIFDNDQILSEKNVGLVNANYEYAGKEGFTIAQIAYFGTNTVKRKNSADPKVKISTVLFLVNNDITVTEFFDADVDELIINADKSGYTLTVGQQNSEPIYFPISEVQNVQIVSSGKIEVGEGWAFTTNKMILIDAFTCSTKILYQIVQGNYDIAVAYLFSNDATDVEFHQGFLDYPIKIVMSQSTIENVKIKSTHFGGFSEFDVDLVCVDSNCQVDCLSSGMKNLLDNNNNVLKPEYLYGKINNDGSFELTPAKSDVTSFNDLSFIGIFGTVILHKCSESERTSYKFSVDIYASKITLDDNIDIQFDCNLFLINSLQIPSNTKIISSPDSGAYVLFGNSDVTIDKLGQSYSRKYNKLLFLASSNLNYREITVQNIGSQDNELNTLSLIFGDDERLEATLSIPKITACRGVYLAFQAYNVVVDENPIHIDKTTLQVNPKFTAIALLQMGNPSSKDLYVYSNITNLQLNGQDFTNLFIDGYFSLTASSSDQVINIDNLYINGQFKTSCSVNAKNLIVNRVFDPSSFPNIQVEKDTYAAIATMPSILSNIETPKLVLSNLDSEIEVKINEKQLDVVSKSTTFSLDTTNHEKVIFYLPNIEVSDEISTETNGNKVHLSVSQNENAHRVLDFNVVTDHEYVTDDFKIPTLLSLEYDDSSQPQFDGNFGYAFEKTLQNRVVYVNKKTGEASWQKPNSFPFNKVKKEPFYNEEDDDDIPEDEIPTDMISSSSSESDSPNSDPSESDSLNPSLSESDSLNPSLSESDSLNPSLSESDSPNSDPSESDSLNPDPSESGSLNPDPESDSLNPDPSESGSLNPDPESDSLNPDPSESGSLNPGLSESDSSNSDSAGNVWPDSDSSNNDSSNDNNPIEITPNPTSLEILPFETPEPLIETPVSVDDNKLDTSNMNEHDKEYIVTIEKESSLIISGNGNDNLYLKVADKVEIEETSATFGIKVDEENDPTVTLNQNEANMNIKGSGSININTNKDIQTLKLGDVLVSHGDKLNVHVEEHITLIEFNNLNLFGKSTFEFTPTKRAPNAHFNNIFVNQGADATISNVVAKNKLEIKPNAFVSFNNVNLDKIHIDIHCNKSNSMRSIMSGKFAGVPNRIEIIQNSNALLEKQVLYIASADINDFPQCEDWKKAIDYSQTIYENCECKDENGLKILYLSTNEQTINYQTKRKGMPFGAIVGLVVGIVAVLAIVIIVVILYIEKKNKANNNAADANENSDSVVDI